MFRLILLKLFALPCFHETLVNTPGLIVEGTANLFWGSGHNASKTKELNPTLWQGQNQMGKLLMKLRTMLIRNTFIPT